MKSITVGQLRQNPTAMLADVESGVVYAITRHGRVIGQVTPAAAQLDLIPARQTGASALASLTPHEPRTASSIDGLIEDARGDR